MKQDFLIRTKMMKSSKMRAIVVKRFGDPSVLEVHRDVPVPELRAHEVLVKVSAVGVALVDTYIRSGMYSRLPPLPYIPGNDMSGTISKIGEKVKGFVVGDLVASFINVRSGAYAEYCAVHTDWLIKLPRGYNLIQAAGIGSSYMVAYRALFQRGNAKPGQTVLIHGVSGGIGSAACQLASVRGLKVIGTTSDPKLVKNKAIDFVVDHTEQGYTKKIMDITNCKGPDIILELQSNVNLNKDLEMICYGGSICVIGCRGCVEINPRLLMAKESHVYGISFSDCSKEDILEMKAAVESGVSKGWVIPLISSKISLTSARKAHTDILTDATRNGEPILLI